MPSPHDLLSTLKHQARQALDENDLEKARALFAEICRLEGDNATAWNILASINGRLGSYDAAEDNCRRAITLDPEFTDAYFNLALIAKKKGQETDARKALEKLVSINPQNANAWELLGDLEKGRRNDLAVNYYQQALTYNPDDTDLQLRYVRCLIKEKHDPHLVGKNMQTALQICKSIQDSQPENIAAVILMASVYENLDNRDAAQEIIKQLLDTHGPRADILIAYARYCKQYKSCDKTITLIQECLDEGACSPNERRSLLFTLGKLYDADGQYANAFRSYEAANQMQPPTAADVKTDALVARLVSVYSPENIRKMKQADNNSTLPVFIIGMPRSGTTLVEQILSRHADVYAAGEIRDIEYIASALSHDTIPYPESMPLLAQKTIDEAARCYLDRISGFAPDARLVTNKSPLNFMHLGLISVLFPAARIIHCMRDPVDTCLSCYFQTFSTNYYDRDLQSLGRFYNNYQRLMRHWKAVLDIPILDVHYSNMVTDPRQTINELLTFCGLDWDDRCMEFHRGNRVVKTASVDQVSRPLYTSSLDRWRNYIEFIGPLVETLELDNPGKYLQQAPG